MPCDAITRVNLIGRKQNMPSTITYSNRHGHELTDTLADLGDDTSLASDSDDDTYSHQSSRQDNSDNLSDDFDSDSSSTTSSASTVNPTTYVNPTPPPVDDADLPPATDVPAPVPHANQGVEDNNHHPHANQGVKDNGNNPGGESDDDLPADEEFDDDLPADDDNNVNNNDNFNNETSDEHSDDESEIMSLPNESDEFRNAEARGRAEAYAPDAPRPRRSTRSKDFTYALSDHACNVTAQMSAKKGLAVFREQGAGALMKELNQVVVMGVMSGCDARTMSPEQKRKALRYLMFLKEKRCGRIKGRGCIDGRKQRLWKSKEDTTSPTVSIEALLLSCMIDAKEERDVATIDIPVAFMQALIDELVHVKFDGELIDLICQVDPSLTKFVAMEKGKRVLYTKLNKALYGTLQASRLFWERLSAFLIEDNGFERNPYDFCVVNKLVNGKQLTVVWYVDDLKVSHADSTVVDVMIESIKQEFGQKLDVTVCRGKIHNYLGLRMDFSEKGQVVLTMHDFISELLKEVPDELLRGPSSSPASNHLFQVNEAAMKLNDETAVLYHHLTAKLLYLSKRTRPDLLTAVSFLCTRVQSPDADDWKKLGRCITYLRDTANLKYTLSMQDGCNVQWWVDASYGVHPDLKSHTGATMSMGRGCLFSILRKQKLNTRSSTDAELVGVDDAMSLILWTRLFLQSQGYKVESNVLYQDNQSAMLLERNGKMSSGKRTRHLDIRFFFVTDNIGKRHLQVDYCPTDNMIGDFFTKPLQGTKFTKFRGLIMGSDLGSPLETKPVHKECVEDNGSEIPDVDDVESGSATSWTEVIKKKTDVFLGKSRMISHD